MSIVRTAYAFTPTAISNCALWLDGADSSTMFQNTGATTPITADGQTIAAWKDKSPNAYVFTQPTAGNQPTYKVGIQNGCSLTRWNGTSTGLQSSTALPFYTSASSGGSFFFVFMITSNSSQRFLMTYQNQTSGTFCVSESEIGCPTGNVDAGNFGIHQGCSKANVALNQTTTNTYMMMNLNLLSSGTAPANTTIFKNGTSSAMTAQNGGFYSGTTYPYTNNARYLNIGYRVPVGTYPIDCWLAGDIAEIIWYQNPVTDAQRQTIEGYLAQKWGLTSSLAAGHPGLTTRVYRSDYLIPNKVKPTPYYTFFSPRQIPGLVVWLDGADPAGNGVIPANGSTISTWTDKSGNGNNGTAVNTPTYALSSRGVATSSGAYFTLPNGAFPFNDSSYTYFFVFTTTTTGSVNSLFGGGVPGTTRSTVAVRLGTNGANNVIQTYWWANGINDLLVSNTYTANTISIAETWYATGSTRTITLNFAGSSTDSPAVPGARLQANTNNYLGLAYPGDGALTGFHYEFLVYNTSLSTTQRQQVESYLAQKWGLTASIPVGHSHLTQQAGAVTTTALSKFKVIGLPQRFMSATGGTVTTVGSFKFHTFTYPGGTFTVTANPSTVQVLVVGGGGGGGGYYNGGGGGAGGAVYNSSFSVSITSYIVTIGNGGAGASGGNNPGINGTSGGASTFSTLTGNGGGGGGADNYVNGLTGGCGGGMGPLGASAPGSGNQGYAGGYGTNGPNMGTLGGAYGSGYGGGGGGGMGSVGSNALTSAGPGYGGTGYTYVVGGQNYLVAGGGGGGTADTDNTNFGLGGSSIGGVGGLNTARVAGNGAANTGSGGGGYGRVGTGSAGGSGGTGIVVIAYRVS